MTPSGRHPSAGARKGDRRDRSHLAPSVQKAHQQVLWGFAASVGHGVLLLGAGLWTAVTNSGATLALVLTIGGAMVVPALGRLAYRGNPLAGLLLVVSVLAPFIGVFLADWDPLLPFAGLLFLPFYWQAARGSTGLRGRRR